MSQKIEPQLSARLDAATDTQVIDIEILVMLGDVMTTSTDAVRRTAGVHAHNVLFDAIVATASVEGVIALTLLPCVRRIQLHARVTALASAD